MARLKPEHLAELRRLLEVNTAMVRFFVATEPRLAQFGSDMQQVILTTAERQDLRGMRTIAQELRNISTAFSPAAQADLRQSVRQTTGYLLEEEEGRDAVAASRILKRARIRNDREYYTLRGRLDRIEGQPGHEAEEQALLSLLDSYRA